MRTGVTENTPAQAQWAAVTASRPTAARVQDEKRDLFMSVLVFLEAHQQLERPVGPEIARSAGVLDVVQAQHRDGTPAGCSARRIFCRRLVHRPFSIDGHRVAEGSAVHAEE